MPSYEQANDWLPTGMFIVGMFTSGIGAMLAAVNKLWGVATFFVIVFAVSMAATLIYSM